MKTRTLATACACVFVVGLVAPVSPETPPDSDNDGVSDVSDNCPTTYGSGSDGCPTEKDIEEVTVVGARTIRIRNVRGHTIDCTNPTAAWSNLCSGFFVPRFGAWYTQSPRYRGTWNPEWKTRNDHISCPATQVPEQGEEQSWRCACAPGYRNETGCGPTSGMTCISTAEFLDNAGPPPQCLCAQPTLPYCSTTWQCPPENVCNIMWYVIPKACELAVAAIGGVVCNSIGGRIVCTVVADQVEDLLDVCPAVGPPISPEDALGGEGGPDET